MRGSVQRRLFDRLADLIPAIKAPLEGATFYAPPRIAGDIACYAVVRGVVGRSCELEIAHDSMLDGRPAPSPWMSFKVDVAAETAELLAIEDQWRYEVLYCSRNSVNPRVAQLNAYALNCLAVILNLGGGFRAVDAPINTAA